MKQEVLEAEHEVLLLLHKDHGLHMTMAQKVRMDHVFKCHTIGHQENTLLETLARDLAMVKGIFVARKDIWLNHHDEASGCLPLPA